MPRLPTAAAVFVVLALDVLLASPAKADPPDSKQDQRSAPVSQAGGGQPADPASAPDPAQPSSAPASQPGEDPDPESTEAPSFFEQPPYAGLDHTGTPPLPDPEGGDPPPSAKPGDRRPAPDYDGRPPRPADAGEGLIWVPRVVFFPVHLVLEYVVRWPIVKGITLAEKHHVFERVQDFFTFNEGRGGLFPTLFFDFGLSPAAGIYLYYDDLLFPTNSLTVQFGFWDGWYHAIATDSFKVFRDDSGTITIRGEFVYRPDYPFYGLGPDSQHDDKRFFHQRRTVAWAGLRAALKGLNRVDFGLQYTNVAISNSSYDDKPIEGGGSPFDPADPTQVPGYDSTYNLLTAKLKFELDTRKPDRVFTPGTGLRVELFTSFSFDPSLTDLLFLRWGGDVSGFWDITGVNHVLAARVYVEALESFGDREVPITERVSLGGTEYMRGFLDGRFRGDSALVFTLGYRYPVWSFLDAYLGASVGNVFMGRFEDFDFNKMVMSWGIGLRSNTSREVSFDLMVAFGTNQFSPPPGTSFRVDNVRFVFGVNQGF